MGYAVRRLTKEDNQAIEDFLNTLGQKHPSVLGYHFPFYAQMLETINVGEACFLGCFTNDALVGVLPAFIKQSALGIVFSSMPYFGPNAGVLTDFNKAECKAIEEAVLQYSVTFCEENNAISSSYYTPFLRDDISSYQTLDANYEVDKFTTYINLDGFKLSTDLKYDIRKAEKSGVVLDTDITPEDIDGLFAIYKQNCEDYDIPPKPYECVKFLMENSGKNPQTKTYLAKVNGKLIGGLIMIYGPNTASYYLPCSIHEYRSSQPTTFLINQAINDCYERNIGYWNWESSPSKESGVYKFKNKWGGTDGTYKIFVKTFRDKGFFRQTGREAIGENYPYFFVFPFNKLDD